LLNQAAVAQPVSAPSLLGTPSAAREFVAPPFQQEVVPLGDFIPQQPM